MCKFHPACRLFTIHKLEYIPVFAALLKRDPTKLDFAIRTQHIDDDGKKLAKLSLSTFLHISSGGKITSAHAFSVRMDPKEKIERISSDAREYTQFCCIQGQCDAHHQTIGKRRSKAFRLYIDKGGAKSFEGLQYNSLFPHNAEYIGAQRRRMCRF